MSIGPKQAIFAELASLARAIGHQHRIEILEMLAQGDLTVEALVDRIGLTVANTSQHLQNLKRAGLITSRREGKFVHYRITDNSVVKLVTALRIVGEANIATVSQIIRSFFDKKDDFAPVSRAELVRLIKDDKVVLLDIRPPDEFAKGHITGARNIPLAELGKNFASLPKGKEVIAYCRGPYCVMSFDAVEQLRKKGLKARRLEEGFPEWKAAGLKVETAHLSP